MILLLMILIILMILMIYNRDTFISSENKETKENKAESELNDLKAIWGKILDNYNLNMAITTLDDKNKLILYNKIINEYTNKENEYLNKLNKLNEHNMQIYANINPNTNNFKIQQTKDRAILVNETNKLKQSLFNKLHEILWFNIITKDINHLNYRKINYNSYISINNIINNKYITIKNDKLIMLNYLNHNNIKFIPILANNPNYLGSLKNGDIINLQTNNGYYLSFSNLNKNPVLVSVLDENCNFKISLNNNNIDNIYIYYGSNISLINLFNQYLNINNDNILSFSKKYFEFKILDSFGDGFIIDWAKSSKITCSDKYKNTTIKNLIDGDYNTGYYSANKNLWLQFELSCEISINEINLLFNKFMLNNDIKMIFYNSINEITYEATINIDNLYHKLYFNDTIKYVKYVKFTSNNIMALNDIKIYGIFNNTKINTILNFIPSYTKYTLIHKKDLFNNINNDTLKISFDIKLNILHDELINQTTIFTKGGQYFKIVLLENKKLMININNEYFYSNNSLDLATNNITIIISNKKSNDNGWINKNMYLINHNLKQYYKYKSSNKINNELSNNELSNKINKYYTYMGELKNNFNYISLYINDNLEFKNKLKNKANLAGDNIVLGATNNKNILFKNVKYSVFNTEMHDNIYNKEIKLLNTYHSAGLLINIRKFNDWTLNLWFNSKEFTTHDILSLFNLKLHLLNNSFYFNDTKLIDIKSNDWTNIILFYNNFSNVINLVINDINTFKLDFKINTSNCVLKLNENIEFYNIIYSNYKNKRRNKHPNYDTHLIIKKLWNNIGCKKKLPFKLMEQLVIIYNTETRKFFDKVLLQIKSDFKYSQFCK